MTKFAIVPLLLASAAMSACSGGDSAANVTANEAENVSASVSADASGNMASAGENQEVELAANGLTTGQRGLHHANTIEFGQPREAVLTQISAVLGTPTGTGTNAECPSGPVEFASFGSLDLHFEDGRFAGWVIDEPGGPLLESYHGLSHGDMRSELDADGEIETVGNSTLGTELSVNGIGVLMSGPGPSDRVTTLFAGVTCFAR